MKIRNSLMDWLGYEKIEWQYSYVKCQRKDYTDNLRVDSARERTKRSTQEITLTLHPTYLPSP